MKFQLEQNLDVAADAAVEAFANPDFAVAAITHNAIGRPELVEHGVLGDRVHLEVRYHFVGELNAAARAILDPAKLTWVQVSDHDLVGGRVVFRIVPDHYVDRLKCAGRYLVAADESDNTRSRRLLECELNVRAPLVAGQVERVLVDGIKDEFADQVTRLGNWVQNIDLD